MSELKVTENADLVLYGLKNCDRCRAALKALAAAGKHVEFVDVRADILPPNFLNELFGLYGDDALNRRSTTWRQLDATEREKSPLDLLKSHPTLMKRPVIEQNGRLYLGWTDAVRSAVLG